MMWNEENPDFRLLTSVGGIDKSYLQYALTVLGLHKIKIQTEIRNNHLYFFFVSENSQPTPLAGDSYGLLSGKIAGFTFARDTESIGLASQRQREFEKTWKEENENEDAAVPFFSAAVFRALIQAVEYDLIRERLSLSPDQFQKLVVGLRKKGRSFQLRSPDDMNYEAIFFTDLFGVNTPIKGGVYDGVGAVLFPRSANRATKAPRTVLDIQEDAYHAENLTPAKVINYEQATFFDFIHELENGKDKKEKETPLNTTDEEIEVAALRAEFVEYFQKQLEPFGLELHDARDILQPGKDRDLFGAAIQLNEPFPLFDFFIVDKTAPQLAAKKTQLFGWKKLPKNSRPGELTIYENVYGIVLVPNSLPVDKRKHLIRRAAVQARAFISKPKPFIFTVDQQLLDTWKGMASPFPNMAEMKEVMRESYGAAQKARVDYGHVHMKRGYVPEVELHIREPKGRHVGGAHLALVVHRDKEHTTSNVLLLDMGWMYDVVPTWSGIGKAPPVVEGILPFLRMNMLDQIRRLYRLDLIELSVFNPESGAGLLQNVFRFIDQPTNIQRFYSNEEFLYLELFHRIGEDQLRQRIIALFRATVIGRSYNLDHLFSYLRKRHEVLYKKKKSIFDAGLVTHAHTDHAENFSFLRIEVPLGMSSATRALLARDAITSSYWLAQEVAIRKMYEEPMISGSYQVQERPYFLFEDGQTIETSENVFVTAFSQAHSIPGAVGYFTQVYSGKGKNKKRVAAIGYPGDYKDGRFFTSVGALLKKQPKEEQFTDIAIVEGTNPPTTGSRESSKFLTEDDVAQRFDRAFIRAKNEDRALIIDLQKNATERLNNIIQIASVRGKTIVLSAGIAKSLQLLELVSKAPDLLKTIFPGNPRIKIWKSLKKTRRSYETDLLNAFGAITPSDIARNPNEYVLIRENENPQKLEGVGDRVLWIYSASQAMMRDNKESRFRKQFAASHNIPNDPDPGWVYLDEGFHASGHAFLVDASDEMADESALSQLHLMAPKKVIPLHTKAPQPVSAAVRSFVPNSEVIDTLPKDSAGRARFNIR